MLALPRRTRPSTARRVGVNFVVGLGVFDVLCLLGSFHSGDSVIHVYSQVFTALRPQLLRHRLFI
ncbi:hypothetical protein EXIGLDRAFT_721080 [Exidia glandulosa HHB12029]|uniref:Uncharacterized protein n=1 Tax=Exidia glandulosa HHB12029 TaxID=1314781 RepID=A0A165FZL3_EXIGL|nr:hypothetical protein EXIGLDRAFT_721080 [Exidia glandulosa HHB12029]